MVFFNEILQIWKSENLLSQAWEETSEMMDLSHDMFEEAISSMREGVKRKKLLDIKKRDRDINAFQRGVRKKVITHFSITSNKNDIPNGMVLLSIIIDVERLGDYTKNILDLAINYKQKIISEELLPELREIEIEVEGRFKSTFDAINIQNEKEAQKLLKTYEKDIALASDKIVNGCISGDISFDDSQVSTVVSLYARYLKRVGAHLKNITTTITNPYEHIGYKNPNS
ncbi:hypothetical protein N8331_00325 [bacterium]|jgi:phosphate transport system protein|nr:hypothetical protein [bacterium]